MSGFSINRSNQGQESSFLRDLPRHRLDWDSSDDVAWDMDATSVASCFFSSSFNKLWFPPFATSNLGSSFDDKGSFSRIDVGIDPESDRKRFDSGLREPSSAGRLWFPAEFERKCVAMVHPKNVILLVVWEICVFSVFGWKKFSSLDGEPALHVQLWLDRLIRLQYKRKPFYSERGHSLTNV